jgi:hypothetical protein
MIDVRPYDDHAAFHVLTNLDAEDHREAEVVRGAPTTGLAIFSDWRAIEAARLLSLVIATGHHGHGTPFAVLGLSHSGQAGVAQAAMLSRNHLKFRRPLAELALQIRRQLPVFAAEYGVRRIEARSLDGHPTAGAFLTGCGFQKDCIMPGFGPNGRDRFVQFSWTHEEET